MCKGETNALQVFQPRLTHSMPHATPVLSQAGQSGLGLAPASLLWPWLDSGTAARCAAALACAQTSPACIPVPPDTAHDMRITIQLPSKHTPAGPSPVVVCTLLHMITVPAAAAALEALLEDVRHTAATSSEWHYAWGLGAVPPHAAASDTPQQHHHRPAKPASASTSAHALLMPCLTRGNATPHPTPPPNISACMAVLAFGDSVAQPQLLAPSLTACAPYPGRGVMVVGSPFGCLAPHHFANTVMQVCCA
jgi:hypothetical protein